MKFPLDSLIQKMDNHARHYDNGLDLSELKVGDSFWLIGNNVPVDFVERNGDELIFMQCCGWGPVHFDVSYFPKLIPTKPKVDNPAAAFNK